MADRSTGATLGSSIVPFLKWAGGKRWFVEHSRDLLPSNFERYVEPFLGSGALYFSLRPKRAMLADLNPRLIETYSELKTNWQKVVTELSRHHKLHDEAYYYTQRAKNFPTSHQRAAQFIYLNRTCWNGLYRVNRKGSFNVPIGTKTSVLLDTDDFAAVAKQLSYCTLLACDFEEVLQLCGKGDLVFVDPPYTVKHNLNGFVKYNEKLFSWDDQVRLRDCIVSATEREARIVMTNADHPSIRALYHGVGTLTTLERASVLAAKSSYRGRVSEIVVVT